jgi:hypothetical protein
MLLIDVAIPGDRNVIKKKAEKILKYKNLIQEIQPMWNVKSKLVPVIVWAAGAISESLRQYLSNIPVIVWVTGAISESLRQYLSNIPVIVWAAGAISESLRQYLSNTPGKHEIKEMQKASHIGHCTLTAGSADVKVQNTLHRRNNITCSTDCKYRTAATLHTVGTWFVCGVYL